jgi:diketogulonate reductase-like aldo/keto reductase
MRLMDNCTTQKKIIKGIVWHEGVTISKSIHTESIAEKAGIFDYEISEEDMKVINGLDEGKRVEPDPDSFDFSIKENAISHN